MSWKNIKLPQGTKLFHGHHFTFMHAGKTFLIEVDEFADGTFTGHAEHSTDKSFVIESVSGKSLQECLENLTKKIQTRS